MTDHPDYLWDRSGDPDPQVRRLETLLGEHGYRGGQQESRRHASASGASPAARAAPTGDRWLAAAAVLLCAVAIAGLLHGLASPRVRVVAISGAPEIAGELVSGPVRARAGGWLVTDASSRALIEMELGSVEVAPGSAVRIARTRASEHRLELGRGAIRARTTAAPRRFFVDTPSGVAVDLGCEFELASDEEGRGRLAVTSGRVAFETDGRAVVVPAGGVCPLAPSGPGTPRRLDAGAELGDALERLDFGDQPEAALGDVLAHARPADGLTLWHLLPRWEGATRRRILERLATLCPPPPRVEHEDVMHLDHGALSRWQWRLQAAWAEGGESPRHQTQ